MTRPLNAASLARLRRRFDQVPDQMKDAARKAIDETAEAMVAEMRRAIDTRHGNLAASVQSQDVSPDHAIRVRITAGGPLTTKRVRNGADATYDYAMAVEYGTDKASPEPFFRPTRDRHLKRLRFWLRGAIKKALAGMASQNPD